MLLLHLTPQITEGFQVFQKQPSRPFENLACSRPNSDAANKTKLGKLVVHVKTIRNNLFHGGKYPNTPKIPAERDAQLLKSGIVMLDELLRLSESMVPQVKHFFDVTMPPLQEQP